MSPFSFTYPPQSAHKISDSALQCVRLNASITGAPRNWWVLQCAAACAPTAAAGVGVETWRSCRDVLRVDVVTRSQLDLAGEIPPARSGRCDCVAMRYYQVTRSRRSSPEPAMTNRQASAPPPPSRPRHPARGSRRNFTPCRSRRTLMGSPAVAAAQRRGEEGASVHRRRRGVAGERPAGPRGRGE